jgi:hypothetical protein
LKLLIFSLSHRLTRALDIKRRALSHELVLELASWTKTDSRFRWNKRMAADLRIEYFWLTKD